MARHVEFDRTKALDQAMHTFWYQGYTATSVDDLTRAMGIKPGSLYNTFKDKHTLFLEALNRYQATDGACLFQALVESPPGREAIHTLFAGLVDQIVMDRVGRGCFMLNSTLELAAHDPAVAALAAEATHMGEGLFRRAIEGGQAAGEISTAQSADDLARFLMATVKGLQSTGKVTRERHLLEATVQVALSVLD
jgi:TetR/AcrR family transcriptional regulator, transcriptional repressor for nem operon